MSDSANLINKADKQALVLEHIANTYRGTLSEAQVTALNYTSSLLKEIATHIEDQDADIGMLYSKVKSQLASLDQIYIALGITDWPTMTWDDKIEAVKEIARKANGN